jgi:hypothetical protein
VSIFALIALVAAFILCFVPGAHRLIVPGLIALGVVLALIVTSGTIVTAH